MFKATENRNHPANYEGVLKIMDRSMSESDRPAHPTLIGEWEVTLPWQNGKDEQTNHINANCKGNLPPLHINPLMKTHERSITHISHVTIQPNSILCGDSQTVLRTLPDDFFACCITSPPYWDTRYSGFTDRLGYEDDYREYIRNLVQVFREVRRTLTPSGTLWLVIGDTYASDDPRWWAMCKGVPEKKLSPYRTLPDGFKPKDLMGIPWRLAIDLQNDGWYLRSDIVWSIPNHRCEPVRDRPARSHDYVFLFAKSEQYAYHGHMGESTSRRTVWEIPTVINPSINYAVFPEPLVERCMRAGSLKNDVVLDPFFGSGTVGIVAKRLMRRYVGIELNPDYVTLAGKRIREVT
jgi:site-specific DNA-methyltransferase (adenine-specific)